jgi:hypothetical protein
METFPVYFIKGGLDIRSSKQMDDALLNIQKMSKDGKEN